MNGNPVTELNGLISSLEKSVNVSEAHYIAHKLRLWASSRIIEFNHRSVVNQETQLDPSLLEFLEEKWAHALGIMVLQRAHRVRLPLPDALSSKGKPSDLSIQYEQIITSWSLE